MTKNNSNTISEFVYHSQIALRNLLNFQNRMRIDIRKRQTNKNTVRQYQKIASKLKMSKSFSKEKVQGLVNRLSQQNFNRNNSKVENFSTFILNSFKEKQSSSSSRLNRYNISDIDDKTVKKEILELNSKKKASDEEGSQIKNFRSHPISQTSFSNFYNKELKFITKRKKFISDMNIVKEKADLYSLKEYFHPKINNHPKKINRSKMKNSTTKNFNLSNSLKETKGFINSLEKSIINYHQEKSSTTKQLFNNLKFSSYKQLPYDSEDIFEKKIKIKNEEKNSPYRENDNAKLNIPFSEQICDTLPIEKDTPEKKKETENAEYFSSTMNGSKKITEIPFQTKTFFYSIFHNRSKIRDELLKPVLTT